MKKLTTILAASALVVGCASHPDRIIPTHVSHERYASESCASIDQQLTRATSHLEAVSNKQRSSMMLDAVTVFFTLIPASAIAGDHQSEVSIAKGDVEALKTARTRCTSTSSPMSQQPRTVSQPVTRPSHPTDTRVGPNTLRCVTQPNGTTLVCD